MPELRVAIVGAGIGGLTLAHCLRRRGIAFEAVEIEPTFAPVGAGIALGANAMAVLRRLGIGDAVEAVGSRIDRAFVTDFRGRVLSQADLAALAPRFGSSVALHRADLSDALAGGLASAGVRLGVTASAVEDEGDGVRVAWSDGSEGRFDLVVGADGIGSGVREKAVAPRERLYSGYTCWRLCVPFDAAALPGLHVGWEMWGPGRRFGIGAIGRGLVYCFAVRNAPRGREDPEAGRAARLREIFEAFAPPVGAILERTRDADVHHADIDELAEGPWRKGRVVLLGDAAHALTPNMGQGAAMAIEDAWVLAEQLGTAGSVPEALARYEALRGPRVRRVQRRSRALGRLSQLESRRLGAVRDLAARFVPPKLAARGLASFLEDAPVVVPGR